MTADYLLYLPASSPSLNRRCADIQKWLEAGRPESASVLSVVQPDPRRGVGQSSPRVTLRPAPRLDRAHRRSWLSMPRSEGQQLGHEERDCPTAAG